MSYKGDRLLGSSLSFKFTSVNVSGAPTTLGGGPIVSVYVDNSLTQFVTGVTLTVDFDGLTGLNNLSVAATSGNGFATGHDYEFVVSNGTAGGVSYVGYTIGSFSIGMCTQAIVNAVWDEAVTAHNVPPSFGYYTVIIEAFVEAMNTYVGVNGAGLTAIPTNTALANGIADALLDRASGVETSFTPRQALRLLLAASAGKLSGAATTTVAIRDVNDTKNRISATVDADGNRTAVSTDVS